MSPFEQQTERTGPQSGVAEPRRAAALARHRKGPTFGPNEIKRFILPPPRGGEL